MDAHSQLRTLYLSDTTTIWTVRDGLGNQLNAAVNLDSNGNVIPQVSLRANSGPVGDNNPMPISFPAGFIEALAAALAAAISAVLPATGTGSTGSTGTTDIVPVTTVAASGAAQAMAFPASGSAAFDITLTANCAITLAGGTTGQYQTVTLILRQNSTAGWMPTLPAGVKWANGGTAPTPNTLSGIVDVFTFSTPDGGATIFGSY
jgi:hypothetical protein